jgi:hypothetical protein
VRLWVIPSVFAWVIASSDTWGSSWLQISCYFWWLLPPRWLGAAKEHWRELVIVRGHLLMIVRGLVPFLAESWKVSLVDCSCHWVTSLVGRFLRCPSVGLAWCQLAREPPSVGRHNGDERTSKHVNLRRKIVCLIVSIGILPAFIDIHIDWLVTCFRLYNQPTSPPCIILFHTCCSLSRGSLLSSLFSLLLIVS